MLRRDQNCCLSFILSFGTISLPGRPCAHVSWNTSQLPVPWQWCHGTHTFQLKEPTQVLAPARHTAESVRFARAPCKGVRFTAFILKWKQVMPCLTDDLHRCLNFDHILFFFFPREHRAYAKQGEFPLLSQSYSLMYSIVFINSVCLLRSQNSHKRTNLY